MGRGGERQKPLYERGFTFVEVMLTVAILAVCIVGVLRAYTALVGALETAQYSIEAVCLLKEQMWHVEADAIENSGIFEGRDSGAFEGRYKNYTWNTEAVTLDFSEREELRDELRDILNEVKLTVVNSRVRPPRRFSLTTYMRNRLEEEEE